MPINYELPTVYRIDDKEYPIRNKGDYRVILDTISALDDKDLTENDRIFAALYIFYEGGNIPVNTETAVKEMFDFISRGTDEQAQPQKIMDWEQDFPILIYLQIILNKFLTKGLVNDIIFFVTIEVEV